MERGKTYRFRQNDKENTIEDGIALLEEAELLVAHNGLDFDVRLLERLYDFDPVGVHYDTLVMARMVFADEKERDYPRWKRGKFKKNLPAHKIFRGELIGTHGLEAWGIRLGCFKGDYAKMMEQRAADMGITDEDEVTNFVWGKWNQEMDDYCVGDLDVTEALYRHILEQEWSETARRIEHRIHDKMVRQETYGVPVDVAGLYALEDTLRKDHSRLSKEAVDHFGIWFRPTKKYEISAKNKPRAEYGEDDTRKWWGEVVRPKKKLTYRDPTKADRDPDCPYCPIEIKEFNPNSRPQIIDRLQTIYDWEHNPEEVTEKGNPKVNDDVLRGLVDTIPICETLAETFYYKKRLGQVADGQNGWLKKVDLTTGLIHGRVNVGGTQTGRASHSNPNLAQVPKVKAKKIEDGIIRVTGRVYYEDEEGVLGVHDKTALITPDHPDVVEVHGNTAILKGRIGDHGWECRDLFGTSFLTRAVVDDPEDWITIGSDLSGIELRMLGQLLAEFDGGEYIRLLLEDDIHTVHQNAAGLDSRDKAKTLIYALIYGAGDEKLGSIIDPAASKAEQRHLGAEARRKLMTRLPALSQAIKKIQKQARKKGYLWGLDQRKLYVRSQHSALNTQLQSNGALVAKVWNLFIDDMLEEEGLVEGWKGDFVPMLWIHDEVQYAVRKKYAHLVMDCMTDAALSAGEYFDFQVPTPAEAKQGPTWAHTH
jgi:DNA polymerase I-like protein with 3'-5' exonuclease and polymerase domains